MTLTLRDDGSNGDETAADGIYSHVFTPTLPGPYGGTIAATGTHADQPFSRSAVWAAPVEDETARESNLPPFHPSTLLTCYPPSNSPNSPPEPN